MTQVCVWTDVLPRLPKVSQMVNSGRRPVIRGLRFKREACPDRTMPKIQMES
jgi:hypothetical protein